MSDEPIQLPDDWRERRRRLIARDVLELTRKPVRTDPGDDEADEEWNDDSDE